MSKTFIEDLPEVEIQDGVIVFTLESGDKHIMLLRKYRALHEKAAIALREYDQRTFPREIVPEWDQLTH